jgi:AraC-like DNA-binding protein
MLASSDDFAVKPFSDGMAPAHQSFAIWDRLLNKWLLGAHSRALSADPFRVSVRLRVLPEMRFGWGTLGASAYERSRDVVAAENDDLMLFMNLAGPFMASHAGRDIELKPGEAYVMACSERGSQVRPAPGKLLCLRMGRNAIQPRVRQLDDRLGRVIAADNEGLRLLSKYLRVSATEPMANDALRQMTARHMRELLALTLGSAEDAREAAQDGSLHAARFRAAKALVQRHLGDPNLSADSVAAPLGISARSLQRLFEREGTTFSALVTGERLAKVYAGLADRGRSIADIAMSYGFGDLSYFNRMFKARYRASPSDVRRYQAIRRGIQA